MPSILDPIPNNPFYYPQTNALNTPQGVVIAGSGVSVDQFGVMNVASALGGTVTSVTAGVGLSGGSITVSGTLDLVPATNVSLGGIKVGANLLIAPDGTLSALPPGSGTINNINVGTGLTGGGVGPSVTINLSAASTTQFGGVVIGPGINVAAGLISLAPTSTGAIGGIRLATLAEVITGVDATKAVTPATLAAKTASTLTSGLVQLSDSVATNDSTKAATQTAAKTAYDAAVAAQTTANAALPLAGGTLTGIITFAAGQTFPGVSLPLATTTSPGVVIPSTGLAISAGGYLTTVNNGTVTSIVAGVGLGAPATGNAITTTGTLKLLPPSTDGLVIGGVKEGANIIIAADGEITTENLLQTNNPYAYNSYIWPATATPVPAAPGANGSFLTLVDNVTGELAWNNVVPISTINVSSALTKTQVGTVVNLGLAGTGVLPVGIPSETFGATAQIPVFTVNAQGQIISAGLANPFSPFQIPTNTAPFNLVLDFAENNLNWDLPMVGNTMLMNPSNCMSGQQGNIIIRQNSLVPYTLTFSTAWKFPNFTPVTITNVTGAVDMIQFTVVDAAHIIVTNFLQNIG
jgi:hypothetical protein